MKSTDKPLRTSVRSKMFENEDDEGNLALMVHMTGEEASEDEFDKHAIRNSTKRAEIERRIREKELHWRH